MYKKLKDYEGNATGLFIDLLSKKALVKKVNNEKYAADALKFGATLIGECTQKHTIPSNYKSYQLKCGHIADYKFVHVRAGLFRCDVCKQAKYKEAADIAGLEIIDGNPIKDADYKLYRYKSCGHDKLLATHNVACLKHGICLICEEATRFEDADKHGLELIDINDVSKWMHRNYRFKECGHIQSIQLSRVTTGRIPRCKACHDLQWVKEAEDEGLEFLGVSNTRLTSTLYDYRLPCGCIKPMTTGTVRLGVWVCNNHSNYYCKPSNVYLFKFETEGLNWLKLGISSRLERRLGDYKMKVPYKCTTLYVVPTKTNQEAIKYEKALHASHTSSRIEYVGMKQLMTNGGNECYPMCMEDYFVSSLKDFEKELNGN